MDELSVEGHVDEGVEAAVQREQPEQPAERRHCKERREKLLIIQERYVSSWIMTGNESRTDLSKKSRDRLRDPAL